MPMSTTRHMGQKVPKGTSFGDRLNAAEKAKKAELEKFRARSGASDPAFAERQAARQAVSVARDARTAERNASRLAGVAREAAEQTAGDAAVEAEEPARDARYAAAGQPPARGRRSCDDLVANGTALSRRQKAATLFDPRA
jgi:hypothetical protein